MREIIFLSEKALSDEKEMDNHHRFFVPLDNLQNWLAF